MTNEVQGEKVVSRAKRTKWTKEKCVSVAEGYTNRSVFHKEAQSAYQAARRLGVLDEICAHMTVEKRGRKSKKVEEPSQSVEQEKVALVY